MNKTKRIALFAVVSLFAVSTAATVSAGSNWEDYFSRSEAKSIKKMVKKSLLNELEDPDKEWKGIIGEKLVGDDIAKKKVITGTAPALDKADKILQKDSYGDKRYYIKISVPEIKASEAPQISLHTKVLESSADYALSPGNIWEENSIAGYEDGAVWIKFADEDNDYDIYSIKDYRLVISY